ncbi:glycosyltransferase family 2 protein [Rhizorhabdus phycosphaerae]|uniref:glycosyltransferase family 2 protein n=1 Tax=Rhizorhabdus phycosphaerae TaxID=2711156 RepID=UPI0013EB8134|nr:glycosyltransferase family 2 protein [Rhizorhabdus phycosphaerae]
MKTADTLRNRFLAFSPRLNRRPVTPASVALHGGALLLLVLLTTQAWHQSGVLAWSVGLAYLGYDTLLLMFVGSRIAPLRHLRPTGSPQGKAPDLAVLVAAHNEAAVLETTVHALLRQSSPPDQIWIVDDGSSDDTAERMRASFGYQHVSIGDVAQSPRVPQLRWIRLPHGGKARALNAALERVECEIVLTVDADTLLAPDAIEAMRTAFHREPALVAATGLLRPICDRSLSGRLFEWFQTYEYVRNFISRFAWMRVDGLLLISGAFAGFRRDAVVAVGGFDPDCLVEDYELIHRLHRWSVDHDLGWKIRVLGEALASTDAPGTIGTFLRQRRRWFGGFLQTQYWNRDMVGNARFGRLGTMMLPVKALDTVQPLYGLVAFALLAKFLIAGRLPVVGPILIAMLAKIIIDLGFHLWSIALYRRWSGGMLPEGWSRVLLASFIEPFSFQLLRHLGAAWGWIAFLGRSSTWGSARRGGILARAPAE